MITRLAPSLLLALIMVAGGNTPASAADLRFTGDQNTDTAAFEMDGPWLLDWSARGQNAMACELKIWANDTNKQVPCNFELRLMDADSGRLLGNITELVGEGHGYKLFEEPGNYKIQVVSDNINWELLISPVSEETAARMKAGPTMAEQSQDAASRVPEGAFVSWRPVDDRTLLLFAEDDATGYRVTFAQDCPGLKQATALSFVTAMENRAEVYDSVLLDNGRQCYFDRVVPTVFK
jgi:hypothetical protein